MNTVWIVVIVIVSLLLAGLIAFFLIRHFRTGKDGISHGGYLPAGPPVDPYQKVYIVEPNNNTYTVKTLNGNVINGYTASPAMGEVYHVHDDAGQLVGSGYLTREAAWESHTENVYTYALQESINNRLNGLGIDFDDGYIVIRYVDMNKQLLRVEVRDSGHTLMDGYNISNTGAILDENGDPLDEDPVCIFSVTESYDGDGCICNEMPYWGNNV